MKKHQVLFFTIFLLFFHGCISSHKVTPDKVSLVTENISIIRVKTREKLTFQELIDEFTKVDMVLVGEYHDDFLHHVVEYLIIEALEKQIPSANVVFEMISSDKQKYIQEAKKAHVKVSELRKAIHWDEKWDYGSYEDIVKKVFYSKWNIVGGNLSKNEINTIFSGAIPIKGTYSITKKVKEKIADIIKQTHKIDDNFMIEKLTQVQQYKDRRMADKLVKSKLFSLLLAGNFHVNKTMGVPLHVKDFNSKKSFYTLFIVDDKQIVNLDEADFIIRVGKGENE